jgi:hypothetical protein
MATSSNKKKATAKENSTARVAERRETGGASRVPSSEKQRSQSRYPGETPLTGEDRPNSRPGRKVQGQMPG